ncbi:MAG: hypothetical protein ACK5RF_16275 [Pirellula sp.]
MTIPSLIICPSYDPYEAETLFSHVEQPALGAYSGAGAQPASHGSPMFATP